MARIASVAVAGFYKTPTHILPRIAALLDIPESTYECRVTFMDPCAGEAEAILALAGKNEIYACEMEATRWGKAKQALGWPHEKNLLHGDAFRISFARGDNDGISVLYLNPPYDTDPVHGRLEQRFLERFTAVLMDDGILLFLVPFYALKASAELLGREYSKLQCYRLPGADFDVFKQVLLVARKSDALFEPDQAIVGQVRAWAADASIIPELPEVGAGVALKVPSSKGYRQGLHEWRMRTVDTKILLSKLRPWHQTTRGGQVVPVPGIVPDLPVQDLLLRSYPVATPPRPAHIAAGIASGLFNGARIEPSDAKTGLPPLLVKGVFDREYRTVEEKKNKDGEVRAVVQVQQPKLVTTVLDLSTHQYHVLRTGAGESRNVEVSSMGVADLLKHYGSSLMEVMERQCPIMYDPRKDAASVELASSPRKLFSAQGHATRAVVKLLGGTKCSNRKGKAAILLGEIGSGKSTVALMTAKTIGSRRPLIMCPPHLLQSWTNEASAVLPEAEVRILQSVADLDEVAQSTAGHMIISVLSRETAKLNHGWVGAGPICPKCGAETPKVDLAKKRARCEEKTLIPVDQLARQCMAYARKLSKYNPGSAQVTQILRGRHDRMRTAHYEKIRKEDGAPKFPGFQAGDFDYLLSVALLDKENSEAAQQAIVMALALAGDEGRIERAARVLLGRESYYSYESFGRNLLLLLAPGGERQTALVEELSAPTGRYSSWNPWLSFKETVEQIKAGKGTKVGKLEVSWVDGVLHIGEHKHDSIELATRLLHPMVKLARFRWAGECGEFLYQAVPEPRRVALAQHITKRHPKAFDLLVVDECFVAGTRVSGKPIETIEVGECIESYDENTRKFVSRKVLRRWVRRPSSLVRVSISTGKSVVCTPNHPFLTLNGWVAAGGLTVGNRLVSKLNYDSSKIVGGGLRLVQNSDYSDTSAGNRCKEARARVLQLGARQVGKEQENRQCQLGRYQEECGVLLGTYANQQPYAEPAECGEDAQEAEWENIPISGWQRETYCASDSFGGSVGLAHGSGDRDRPRGRTVPVPSKLLQSGHRESKVEDSGGSGWTISPIQEVEVPRQTQRADTQSPWVESVEVLEPGSDGTYGGVCPDGLVYNLEVEGTHTYTVEDMVVHNCHEYATDGSAQERSAHRLTSLGIPTILQTGTIMNGYAESLFTNMWALSPDFRNEFSREDKQRFIDRYGYRKRVVEEKDKETGEIVEFGSMSDRVTRSERIVGNAPGVLPLFLLRHLLKISVTLHKADLAIDLPPCKQEVCYVQPSAEQRSNYEKLKTALAAAIKKDQFDKDLAGKLFGQLAELPSYLDRATKDTGNTEHGDFEIRYPESVGNKLVASAYPVSSDELLPKEQWMVDTIVRELSEGRNVMVFSWHVNLLPRYARIISERLGEQVPILYADKVPTAKRQAWIDKEVVKKKRHILVTNPVAIQTGLNNLVHFASEIWMENPGCNPVIFRQAIGRVDRIGQKKETRIFFPIYADTLQVQLYDLLMKKVAVSVSTDGLDPESALQAAGVGEDDYLAGLSIGKQLWVMLTEGEYGSLAA